MKALFVSTHFPKDIAQSTTGAFKRMRTFLEALTGRAFVRVLFYHRPELQLDGGVVAAAMRSQWKLDNFELTLCPQDEERSYGDRLWSGYLARTWSMHRQLGFVRTSGGHQLGAFEACLRERPDVVFAHQLDAMCPIMKTKHPLPPVFMDLNDIEHRIFLDEIAHPPQWFAKKLMYLQWPALVWGERRAIQLTRETFVCSEPDAQHLRQSLRLSNIAVIPNSIQIPEASPFVSEPVLTFLGVHSYKPNAVAAEHLIRRVWPIVRAAFPSAQLIIAGAGPEHIGCYSEQHPGVEYTGFVNDLSALYRQARVVCCPIQSGSGTRIKIIEGAAYAKPIVSTHIGAEGLDFQDQHEILLRDDPQAFASACIELLRNDDLCRRIGAAARAKAIARYDQQSIVREIQEHVFSSVSLSRAA